MFSTLKVIIFFTFITGMILILSLGKLYVLSSFGVKSFYVHLNKEAFLSLL